MMPLLLNIETSTETCSIAISKGKEVLALQETSEAYSHASQITLLIQAALEEAGHALADMDAIALSQGPGSYTALRVGTSTAKGICYALGKPLLAIDTLQALAQASFQEDWPEAYYAPMIDARRMEVYTLLLDRQGQLIQATEAKIIDSDSYSEYLQAGQRIVFSGNGAPKCQTVIDSPHARFLQLGNSARHLVPLAVQAFEKKTFADLAYFSPHYFKSPNITKPKRVL